MTICVDPPCVSGVWRPPHIEVVFSVHWDHGTSASAHRPRLTGGNLSPSPAPSPNIPGDRGQGPGARCSQTGEQRSRYQH